MVILLECLELAVWAPSVIIAPPNIRMLFRKCEELILKTAGKICSVSAVLKGYFKRGVKQKRRKSGGQCKMGKKQLALGESRSRKGGRSESTVVLERA